MTTLHDTPDDGSCRETSRQTFLEIREQGLLRKHKLLAYEMVLDYGPGTASEIYERAGGMDKMHTTLNNFSNRLKELRRLGVLDEQGVRRSSTSGRSSIVWAINGKLPSRTGSRDPGDHIRKILPRTAIVRVKRLIDDRVAALDESLTSLRKMRAEYLSGPAEIIEEHDAYIRRTIDEQELQKRELGELAFYFRPS